MVERWAMVRDDGYVENVCLWDGNLSNWAPPAGITMIRALEDVCIGWMYHGSNFSAPLDSNI